MKNAAPRSCFTRNILRGAVFNGQGMATFCLRFVDAEGRPVTGYTLSAVLPKKKK